MTHSSTLAAAGPDSPSPRWRAELDLHFEARVGRTVLATRRHIGPLMVQRPFYPEGGICHVYLLHPPGGIVGGDLLHSRVTVGPDAHAVLTTPAATKFYRSAGATAEQQQDIRLVAGRCEWLPQESIYFSDSQARVATRVQLDPASRFIGWDIACFGRPASGDGFLLGRVRQAFEVWCGDRPLLIDRLRVDGADPGIMQGRSGLRGNEVLGTFVAYPATTLDLVDARHAIEALESRDSVLAGLSVVDGVLIARCLAPRADRVRAVFMALWEVLRPRLMQQAALAPRVWAT